MVFWDKMFGIISNQSCLGNYWLSRSLKLEGKPYAGNLTVNVWVNKPSRLWASSDGSANFLSWYFLTQRFMTCSIQCMLYDNDINIIAYILSYMYKQTHSQVSIKTGNWYNIYCYPRILERYKNWIYADHFCHPVKINKIFFLKKRQNPFVTNLNFI